VTEDHGGGGTEDLNSFEGSVGHDDSTLTLPDHSVEPESGSPENYLGTDADAFSDEHADAGGVVDNHESALDTFPPLEPLLASDTSSTTDATGTDTPTATPETDGVDPSTEGQFAGDPMAETPYWFEQAEDGWCGPASVAEIVAQHENNPDLESVELEVVARAESLGLLTHSGSDFDTDWSGMTATGLTSLLGSFGISSDESQGTISDLQTELDNGSHIIVTVDAETLWDAEGLENVSDPGTADHALVVTGIDAEHGIVFLNDPGQPEGAASEVSLSTFEQAWSDSDNTMVTTTPTTDDPTTTDPTTTGDPSQTTDPTATDPTTTTTGDPSQTTDPTTTSDDPLQSTESVPTGALTDSVLPDADVHLPSESGSEQAEQFVDSHRVILLPIILGGATVLHRAIRRH
jgi:hypothetical protein